MGSEGRVEVLFDVSVVRKLPKAVETRSHTFVQDAFQVAHLLYVCSRDIHITTYNRRDFFLQAAKDVRMTSQKEATEDCERTGVN